MVFISLKDCCRTVEHQDLASQPQEVATTGGDDEGLAGHLGAEDAELRSRRLDVNAVDHGVEDVYVEVVVYDLVEGQFLPEAQTQQRVDVVEHHLRLLGQRRY